jgi:hypothetical protein
MPKDPIWHDVYSKTEIGLYQFTLWLTIFDFCVDGNGTRGKFGGFLGKAIVLATIKQKYFNDIGTLYTHRN